MSVLAFDQQNASTSKPTAKDDSKSHSIGSKDAVLHEHSSEYFTAQDEDFPVHDGAQDRLERQKWFYDAGHRENITVKKGTHVEMEFSNGLVGKSSLILVSVFAR